MTDLALLPAAEVAHRYAELMNPTPAPRPPAVRTSSDGDSRKRPRQINLRLTDTELADLERLAAANGCTSQAVLRAGLILLTTTETP